MPNNRPDKILRHLPLALLPALFGLLLVCILPMQRAAYGLFFPYQLDREEGFILGDSLAMLRGESIYAPIDEPPYIVGNYGPIYPALVAVLLPITGPSLMPGRLIVLLSVIVVLVSMALIVARPRRQLTPVALALLLFASSWDVNEWIPFARVDFPAMAFGLAGMAALLWMKRGGWAVAGLLFALSVLTKQTMLAAPAAALVALLWCGRWREGALMTAAALVPWGLVTLALQLLTSGEYFRHTVTYNVNVFHWGDLNTWGKHLLRLSMWKLIAAGTGLLILLLAALFPPLHESDTSPPAEHRLVVPIAVAYLIFAAISALGIAKVGSAANYLLELQAALAIIIALAVGEVARGVGRPWLTHAGALLLVMFITIHWILLALWPALKFVDGSTAARTAYYNRDPSAYDLEFGAQAHMRVAEATDPVLCEEPIFQILEGQPLWFEPFIMTQLAKEGRWDETNFVEMLRTGHFTLLVLSMDVRNEDQYFPAFTPAMRAAIREAYEFEQVIGDRYWMFVPKTVTPPAIEEVIAEGVVSSIKDKV